MEWHQRCGQKKNKTKKKCLLVLLLLVLLNVHGLFFVVVLLWQLVGPIPNVTNKLRGTEKCGRRRRGGAVAGQNCTTESYRMEKPCASETQTYLYRSYGFFVYFLTVYSTKRNDNFLYSEWINDCFRKHRRLALIV